MTHGKLFMICALSYQSGLQESEHCVGEEQKFKFTAFHHSYNGSCSRIHQNATLPKGHFRPCSLACMRAGIMVW